MADGAKLKDVRRVLRQATCASHTVEVDHVKQTDVRKQLNHVVSASSTEVAYGVNLKGAPKVANQEASVVAMAEESDVRYQRARSGLNEMAFVQSMVRMQRSVESIAPADI